MKVRFKREGGFAGMTLRQEADLNELPEEAQRALETLKDLPAAEFDRATRTRRDRFLYTFELQTSADPVVLSIDEEDVTKEIAPLIRYFEIR